MIIFLFLAKINSNHSLNPFLGFRKLDMGSIYNRLYWLYEKFNPNFFLSYFDFPV